MVLHCKLGGLEIQYSCFLSFTLFFILTSGIETTENAATHKVLSQSFAACDTFKNNEIYSLGSRYKRSIPPLSANAISADWIHRRRCCVGWFERLPLRRQQTHQFRVASCHGDQVQTLKSLSPHPTPHLTVGQVCVHAFVLRLSFICFTYI